MSRLWVLLLCRVLVSGGFSISFPFLALYLSKERGVPMHWIGVYLSISILGAAVAQSVGGTLADRLGRKPVMLFGLIARTFVVFGLAATIYKHAPFPVIAFLHFMSAVTGIVFDPSSNAWVSDRFELQERVHAFSLLRTGGNLGWAIGPAVGGLSAGIPVGSPGTELEFAL